MIAAVWFRERGLSEGCVYVGVCVGRNGGAGAMA